MVGSAPIDNDEFNTPPIPKRDNDSGGEKVRRKKKKKDSSRNGKKSTSSKKKSNSSGSSEVERSSLKEEFLAFSSSLTKLNGNTNITTTEFSINDLEPSPAAAIADNHDNNEAKKKKKKNRSSKPFTSSTAPESNIENAIANNSTGTMPINHPQDAYSSINEGGTDDNDPNQQQQRVTGRITKKVVTRNNQNGLFTISEDHSCAEEYNEKKILAEQQQLQMLMMQQQQQQGYRLEQEGESGAMMAPHHQDNNDGNNQYHPNAQHHQGDQHHQGESGDYSTREQQQQHDDDDIGNNPHHQVGAQHHPINSTQETNPVEGETSTLTVRGEPTLSPTGTTSLFPNWSNDNNYNDHDENNSDIVPLPTNTNEENHSNNSNEEEEEEDPEEEEEEMSAEQIMLLQKWHKARQQRGATTNIEGAVTGDMRKSINEFDVSELESQLNVLENSLTEDGGGQQEKEVKQQEASHVRRKSIDTVDVDAVVAKYQKKKAVEESSREEENQKTAYCHDNEVVVEGKEKEVVNQTFVLENDGNNEIEVEEKKDNNDDEVGEPPIPRTISPTISTNNDNNVEEEEKEPKPTQKNSKSVSFASKIRTSFTIPRDQNDDYADETDDDIINRMLGSHHAEELGGEEEEDLYVYTHDEGEEDDEEGFFDARSGWKSEGSGGGSNNGNRGHDDNERDDKDEEEEEVEEDEEEPIRGKKKPVGKDSSGDDRWRRRSVDSTGSSTVHSRRSSVDSSMASSVGSTRRSSADSTDFSSASSVEGDAKEKNSEKKHDRSAASNLSRRSSVESEMSEMSSIPPSTDDEGDYDDDNSIESEVRSVTSSVQSMTNSEEEDDDRSVESDKASDVSSVVSMPTSTDDNDDDSRSYSSGSSFSSFDGSMPSDATREDVLSDMEEFENTSHTGLSSEFENTSHTNTSHTGKSSSIVDAKSEASSSVVEKDSNNESHNTRKPKNLDDMITNHQGYRRRPSIASALSRRSNASSISNMLPPKVIQMDEVSNSSSSVEPEAGHYDSDSDSRSDDDSSRSSSSNSSGEKRSDSDSDSDSDSANSEGDFSGSGSSGSSGSSVPMSKASSKRSLRGSKSKNPLRSSATLPARPAQPDTAQKSKLNAKKSNNTAKENTPPAELLQNSMTSTNPDASDTSISISELNSSSHKQSGLVDGIESNPSTNEKKKFVFHSSLAFLFGKGDDSIIGAASTGRIGRLLKKKKQGDEHASQGDVSQTQSVRSFSSVMRKGRKSLKRKVKYSSENARRKLEQMKAARESKQSGGDSSSSAAVPPRPKEQDFNRWYEEQQRKQGLTAVNAMGAPVHYYRSASNNIEMGSQQHHHFHRSATAPHEYGRIGPGYLPLIQEDRSFQIPHPYGPMPYQQPMPLQPYPPPNPHMNYNNAHINDDGGELNWEDLDDAINLGLQYSINDLNQTVSGKQYKIENDIIENNTLGSRRSKKSASSRSQGETKIFAKTLTGKIIKLYVNLDEKVDDIKSRIHDSEGVPPIRQRLVFDGDLLENGHVLSEYKVEEKSTIHLVYTG